MKRAPIFEKYWLPLTVLILGCLYAAVWFFVAYQAESRTAKLLNQIAAPNNLECQDLSVKGFPFKIELHCNKIAASNASGGAFLETGPLRSHASITSPSEAIFQLEGPVEFATTQGDFTSADWERLRARANVGLSGLQSGTLQITRPQAMLVSSVRQIRLPIAAQNIDVHINVDDVDLITHGRAVRLDTVPLVRHFLRAKVPPILKSVTSELDVKILNGAELLNDQAVGDALFWRNRDYEIRNARLLIGDTTSIEGEGMITIAQDGLISGALNIYVSNLRTLAKIAAQLLPHQSKNIELAERMLAGFVDDKNKLRLRVVLDKGRVSSSFIHLGTIPPI